MLKEARLVDVEARAQERVYALRGESLRELHAWLETYRDFWDERMDQMEELIDELQAKPKKKKVKR
ncbi:hypothetical protein BH09MYX1_BH09MYX1_34610 [soil metagenome]